MVVNVGKAQDDMWPSAFRVNVSVKVDNTQSILAGSSTLVHRAECFPHVTLSLLGIFCSGRENVEM